MKLLKIKHEDLFFHPENGETGTNTSLILDDYDWMNYSLTTRFYTKNQGTLNIEFNYFGLVTSTMEVERLINNNIEKMIYEYSTDIFQKHILKFLEKHIHSWDSSYGFDGEEEVINFFNDVIENGMIIRKNKKTLEF